MSGSVEWSEFIYDFTSTKYGFDPENGSTNNYDYPMQRVYAISLNLGF